MIFSPWSVRRSGARRIPRGRSAAAQAHAPRAPPEAPRPRARRVALFAGGAQRPHAAAPRAARARRHVRRHARRLGELHAALRAPLRVSVRAPLRGVHPRRALQVHEQAHIFFLSGWRGKKGMRAMICLSLFMGFLGLLGSLAIRETRAEQRLQCAEERLQDKIVAYDKNLSKWAHTLIIDGVRYPNLEYEMEPTPCLKSWLDRHGRRLSSTTCTTCSCSLQAICPDLMKNLNAMNLISSVFDNFNCE